MSSAFEKVHSIGRHLKALHHWTIFLWRWSEWRSKKKEHCTPLLKNFWGKIEESKDPDEDEQWFQLEDASFHIANVIMAWLREKFRERFINRKTEVELATQ